MTAPTRRLGPTRGWSAVLTLARRDLARNRRRTVLAIAMLAVPLAVASALSVTLRTASVSVEESLPGLLGQAPAALVDAQVEQVEQTGTGETQPVDAPAPARAPLGQAELEALAGSPLVPVRWQPARLTVPGELAGSGAPGGLEPDVGLSAHLVDTREAVTEGMVEVVSGRLARASGEIALSPGALRAAGVEVGDSVTVGLDGPVPAAAGGGPEVTRSLRVVGVALVRGRDAPTEVSGVALPGSLPGGPPETAPPGTETRWLVDRDAPVTPEEVRALNAAGVRVLSPETLLSLPSPGPAALVAGIADRTTATVLAVAAALVVLQVVLLAAPAFAISVRRRREDLALLATIGADDRALRRVVLTQAGAVGIAAAAVAALVALATMAVLWAGRLRLPGLRGPVEASVLDLAVLAVLGVGAALAAAYLPARSAGRADPVAVLRGRRAAPGWPVRRALAGAAAYAAGAGLMLASSLPQEPVPVPAGGLALGVLLCTAGTLLLVPLLVAAAGRVSRWLPLPLRLAGREAARSAERSVAAVAAVAAAAGGVTAVTVLGMSLASFSAETYQPTLPMGVSAVDTEHLGGPAGEALPAETLAAVPAGHSAGAVGQVGTVRVDQDTGTLVVSDWYLPTLQCPDPDGFYGVSDGTSGDLGDRTSGDLGDGTSGDLGEVGDAGCDASGEGRPGFLVAEVATLRALGYRLEAADVRHLEGGGVLATEGTLAALDALDAHTPSTVGDAGDDGERPAADRLQVVPVVSEAAATTPNAVSAVDSGSPVELALARYGGPTPPPAAGPGRPLLVLPETTEGTVGWTPRQVVVWGPDALDAAEEQRLVAATGGGAGYTERGYRPSPPGLEWSAFVAAALLSLAAATLTASGLAREDARPVDAVLARLGASGAARRLTAGAGAFLLALLGGLAGVVLGLAPGAALAAQVTSERVEDVTGRLVTVAPTIAVPWPAVLGLVVVAPVLLGLVVASVGRLRPGS